jgi:hypothetical protein
MKKLLLTLVAGFILSGPVAHAQSPTLTIDWFNNTNTLFRDAFGTPLSQGASAANNDGMLVQLGFFTGATPGNNFAGTWVPLTGFGLTMPRTTIGDSPDLNGLGNGLIGFSTTFTVGSNMVDVFNPIIDPDGYYQTQSSITITNMSPAVGQILAIRFFNMNDEGGAYNTVSADAWTWQAPSLAGTNMLLNIPSQSTQGLLRWEDPNNPFMTSIPEPSTYALMAAGLGAVMVIRRRRNKRNAA